MEKSKAIVKTGKGEDTAEDNWYSGCATESLYSRLKIELIPLQSSFFSDNL